MSPAKHLRFILAATLLTSASSGCSFFKQQQRQQHLLQEFSRLQQGIIGIEKAYVVGVNGKIADCKIAKHYLKNWVDYKEFTKIHPEVFGAFQFAAANHDKTVSDLIGSLKTDIEKQCAK